MSYFKISFTVILSFYSSFSLLGMNLWECPKQAETCHYFDPEFQKALTLIILKNRDQAPFNHNTDVLKIIAKNNYDLHYNELLKSKVGEQSFEKFWQQKLNCFNDAKRIQTHYGKKIEVNDLNFITMNDQGKKIFLNTINVMLAHKSNSIGHIDSRDRIITNQEHIKHLKKENRLGWVNVSEYNEIQQLPLQLRSKMGNLCRIVIEKEVFCTDYRDTIVESGVIEGYFGSGLMYLVSSFILKKEPSYLALMLAGCCGIGFSLTPISPLLFLRGLSKNDIQERVDRIDRTFTFNTKPLVPEKLDETCNFIGQANKHFRKSKEKLTKHQQETTIKRIQE